MCLIFTHLMFLYQLVISVWCYKSIYLSAHNNHNIKQMFSLLVFHLFYLHAIFFQLMNPQFCSFFFKIKRLHQQFGVYRSEVQQTHLLSCTAIKVWLTSFYQHWNNSDKTSRTEKNPQKENSQQKLLQSWFYFPKLETDLCKLATDWFAFINYALNTNITNE